MSRNALENALKNFEATLAKYSVMSLSASERESYDISTEDMEKLKKTELFVELKEELITDLNNRWLEWRDQQRVAKKAEDILTSYITLFDYLQQLRWLIAELQIALKLFTEDGARNKVINFLQGLQKEKEQQDYVRELEAGLTDPADELMKRINIFKEYSGTLQQTPTLAAQLTEFNKKLNTNENDLLQRLLNLKKLIATFNDRSEDQVNVKKFQSWLKGNPNASFDEVENKPELIKSIPKSV